MPLDLQAIKERLKPALKGPWKLYDRPQDVVDLVAEIERLQKLYNQVNTANALNKEESLNLKVENKQLRTAIKQMLDLEAENLEGYDSELHKVGREALGLSVEEYFGESE